MDVFLVYKEGIVRVFASVVTGLIAVAFIGASTAPVHAQEEVNQETKQEIKVEIESGDTLSAVAKEHDTTYRRLFDANKQIEHPDIIFPGDEVRIPDEDEKLQERKLPEGVTPPVVEAKPAPAPAPQPAVQSAPKPARQPAAVPSSASMSTWDRLARCESGGNWSINTGNGYYGGLQFSLSSWRAVGGSGYPHQVSKSEQISRAEKLKAIQGWGAWPACSAKLGLR